MSTIRFTAAAAGLLLAAGSASAQPAGYGTAPAYSPPASYEPPSPYAASSTYGQALSASDAQALRGALDAARSGDAVQIRAAMASLADPLARRIALWALSDAAPQYLSADEAATAANFTGGWPRADRRQIEAERRQLVEQLDAEFASGWTALTRFANPKVADDHFARLQTMSQSPLTQSRALYWRGRAAEAMGDGLAAQLFYAQAVAVPDHLLRPARRGPRPPNPVISLGHDPQITAADRAQLRESRAGARGAPAGPDRGQGHLRDLRQRPVRRPADRDSQEALLVDLARDLGDAVPGHAGGAQRRPARVHPARTRLSDPRHAQPPMPRRKAAFVLGIVRQESSFDPLAHFGRRRARHDAADAGHRPGRGQPDRPRLRRSVRRQLQHDRRLGLPGPVGRPVRRLLCDGGGGL